MSQSDKKDNVVIVGAGVSGLVCAIELEKRGFEPLIIDALPKVGGRLQTILMEDIPLDKGFQVLLSEYPAVKKYLDLEALNLRSFRPGAIVFKGDKQYPMGDPLRDSAFLWDTIRFPFGSIKDKFKVWQLNKQLRGKSIEDIFDSASVSTMSYLKAKGFSDQMIASFFKPFFGGIFLEGDLVTSSRMFEFVFKMFAEGKATLPKRGIQEVAFQLKSKLKKSRFMMKTKVLSTTQIEQKINRLAHQLYENNYNENDIVVLGIVDRGYVLAKRIVNVLNKISDMKVHLGEVKVNKQDPLNGEITLSLDDSELIGKVVFLVDDVINSGRTMIYVVNEISD